jgi:hypothetical protein
VQLASCTSHHYNLKLAGLGHELPGVVFEC